MEAEVLSKKLLLGIREISNQNFFFIAMLDEKLLSGEIDGPNWRSFPLIKMESLQAKLDTFLVQKTRRLLGM